MSGPRTYIGKQAFFRMKFKLYENVEKNIMPAGTHFFNFSYKLPPSIPESFKGSHGQIIYKVVAVHENPILFYNKKSIEFTVKRHNNTPMVRNPVMIINTKNSFHAVL